MAKILVVEDDRKLAEVVVAYLEYQNHTVEHCPDGSDALRLLQSFEYDVIILDVSLPGKDGFEICRSYRNSRRGTAYVLILTGKNSTRDKSTGFDSGADDYLVKPFDLEELSSRIKAMLRRPRALTPDVLTYQDLLLEPDSGRLTKNGKQIQLPKTEFALLEFLMRHPGQVFSPDALLQRVWTSSSDRSPLTIRTCVTKLRSKIDTEGESSLIENVHGFGYKLGNS